MDLELTPEEVRDLLPAYAIDAVDDDERAIVDAYLLTDPDASAEVVSMQQTAAFLAHTGGPPPIGVWERLEATIRAQPRPDGMQPPPRLVPLARHEHERESAPAAEPSRDAPSHRRWRWLAVAAVVVALASFSLWVVDRGGSDPRVDTVALARAADTAPGARHANLQDEDGTTVARAVVLPDGTGYLTSTKLPALDRNRTYQLWGIDDRRAISLGVMGGDPKVIAFHAANDPSTIAITNERAGGVESSTEAPTAVGDLVA
jgi:anti-sigma-K factor RskA